MKRTIVAGMILVVALFALTSSASANFVQPVGTQASLVGTINRAGNIVNTSCAASFVGRVRSSTTLSVTSGTTRCNTGDMTPTLPWEIEIDLAGNWRGTEVEYTFLVPLVGTCTYAGWIGGTYESDGEGLTLLTLTDAASDVRKTSGSSLCTSDPTRSGELEVSVGIA